MTREELRKKRKELAYKQGYKEYEGYTGDYKPTPKKTTKQTTQQTTQQPVQTTQEKVQHKLSTPQVNTSSVERVKQLTANNLTNKLATNTSTQPIKQLDKDKLITKQSAFGYINAKTGLGLERSLRGIVASVVQDSANQEQKGKKEAERIEQLEKDIEEHSGNKALAKIVGLQQKVTTPLRWLNPLANILESGKENKELFEKNNMTGVEKLTKAVQNSVTAVEESNPLYQISSLPFKAIGSLNKDNADKVKENAVQFSKDFLKPTDEKAERLAIEGQMHSGLTQALGSGFENVGQMLPSIVTTGVTGSPELRTRSYGSWSTRYIN